MANATNEKIKRRYFKLLRGANGLAEASIVAIERAIHLFEESTDYKDFKTFSERQAINFKKWLSQRKNKGKVISDVTKYHHLRHLKCFFNWLSTQSGYKSRINLDSVSYLSLDKRTVQNVLSPRPKKYPSKQQILDLVNSIKIENDIDRRDKALISFMFLTGIRYKSICSLSLECIDIERLVVFQDPRLGVHTKGGKAITTWVLKFDNDLIEILKNWVYYLINTLRYSPSDPLFPKTNSSQANGGYSFEVNGLIPEFWRNSNSIRKILKFRSLNAGLPYFNPHSFRHAACQYGLKYSRTPEQFKALSQNFGHESVTTTLRSYGSLDDSRVEDIITNMNFSKNEKGKQNISLDELKQLSISQINDLIYDIK